MNDFKLLLYLSFAFFVSGCIKEGGGECGSTRLEFQYFGDGRYPVFYDKIEKVDMYIYNDQNKLVDHQTIDKEALAIFQGTNVSLSSGTYDLVCIGNAHSMTKIDNVECGVYSEIKVAHPNYLTKERITTNDSLYYTHRSITIEQGVSQENNVVTFQSSHLTFMVLVAHNQPTKSAQPLSLQVENLHPHMNFHSELTASKDELVNYHPEMVYDAKTKLWGAHFHILRHDGDSDIHLKVYSTDGSETVNHKLSLNDFLDDNPHIDKSKQEVLVPMLILVNKLEVEITAPDWIIDIVFPSI